MKFGIMCYIPSKSQAPLWLFLGEAVRLVIGAWCYQAVEITVSLHKCTGCNPGELMKRNRLQLSSNNLFLFVVRGVPNMERLKHPVLKSRPGALCHDCIALLLHMKEEILVLGVFFNFYSFCFPATDSYCVSFI